MSDQHGAPWQPGPGAGEPPASDLPPAGPPTSEPPATEVPDGAPPWAMRPRPPFAAGPAAPPSAPDPTVSPAPGTPGPTPGGPAPAYGATPTPGGYAGAPTTPSAPGAYGTAPAPGGYAPAPTPYAGIPSVAQAYPGAAPVPYARPARKVKVGLPPTMGLAVAFLSFPAIATLGYGLVIMFAGILFSSADTRSDYDFGETGAAIGALGAVLIILGLIGVASVVGLAAGNQAARIMCTVFVSLSLFAQILGFATNPSGGALIATAVFMTVPLYCLWAMWGPPSREVF